jgi:hypothetical protein
MKNNKYLKLITENKSPVKIISEAYDPTKPRTIKFKGIFLVSEKKNGNGRIYPYEELKREVDRFRTEMIETNRALMELEHPSSCEIDPTRASARILSLEEDNKQWIGEAVMLCSDEKHGIRGTVCADTLYSLTQYGTKWGVSSRAMGTVDEETGIVSDLNLVTIDTVLNPSIGEMVTSDGNRFVNGILESKSFVCNNHGEIVECKFNNFEKKIAKMPKTHISSKKADYLGKAVTDFFDSLVK